jgi:hypothetical protein
MNTIFGAWLFTMAFFLMPGFSAFAQNKYWREVRGKPLVNFDWNCASRSTYPKPKLNRLVKTALRNEKFVVRWPDRAFAFDLNHDGRPEYFVPLTCGAVGNCSWGVYALRPARSLGIVFGQFIYVHKQAARWPRIITYEHMSAAEGVLDTYEFRRGQYRPLGKGYAIGPEDRTMEIQKVRGHRMPRFLDQAHRACKNLGQ